MAIVDAGPLVAFLDRNERHHGWARAQFEALAPPLLTCEPVIVETLFLLRRFPREQRQVLDLVRDDTLRLAFSLAEEIDSVRDLMRKYQDVPMSLADACLVRMSELYRGHSLYTLDADFRVYRRHGREPIPAVTPPG